MIKHYDQSNLGNRVYFPYTSISQYIMEGNQGRNMEIEADSEAMKKCYLLACSLGLATTVFFYHLGPLAQKWHHPQWAGSSPSITNKKKKEQPDSGGTHLSPLIPALGKPGGPL